MIIYLLEMMFKIILFSVFIYFYLFILFIYISLQHSQSTWNYETCTTNIINMHICWWFDRLMCYYTLYLFIHYFTKLLDWNMLFALTSNYNWFFGPFVQIRVYDVRQRFVNEWNEMNGNTCERRRSTEKNNNKKWNDEKMNSM